MRPALVPGDVLLCRRLRPADAERGMVVVVSAPWNSPFQAGSMLIKRVAGTSGDVVQGTLVGRPGLVRVPHGCIVLLGDNAACSYDSQSQGMFFRTDEVLSRVLMRLSRRGNKRLK